MRITIGANLVGFIITADLTLFFTSYEFLPLSIWLELLSWRLVFFILAPIVISRDLISYIWRQSNQVVEKYYQYIKFILYIFFLQIGLNKYLVSINILNFAFSLFQILPFAVLLIFFNTTYNCAHVDSFKIWIFILQSCFFLSSSLVT